MKNYLEALKVEFTADGLQKNLKDFSNTFVNGLLKNADSLKTIFNGFQNGFGKGIVTIGNEFLSKLADTFTDAWKELDTMLSYTRLSNAQTRQLAFGYGFNASESYAYTKATELLGFSDIEDLWYANNTELELFSEAFEKYSRKYSELYDAGLFDKMLEYQVEMQEFSEDIKLEFVQFFVDNKELIIGSMNAILTISKAVLKVLAFVGDLFHELTRTSSNQVATESDVVNNYANRTNNIKMDYTFNGVDKVDREYLTQTGQLTYEAIISWLDGGK